MTGLQGSDAHVLTESTGMRLSKGDSRLQGKVLQVNNQLQTWKLLQNSMSIISTCPKQIWSQWLDILRFKRVGVIDITDRVSKLMKMTDFIRKIIVL